MRPYYLYNMVFAGFALTVSYWLVGRPLRRRQVLLSARIALLLTVIYYPWDFFAIRLGVWTYPKDPGLRIYQVPLNDLIFIWLCSFLTCCVLIAVARWRRSSQGEGYSERKEASRQDT
jgi:lycopene cyclase domain-containing protein